MQFYYFFTSLLAAVVTANASSSHGRHFNYTVIPGFFLQDDPGTDPDTFDFMASNFGLINRTYDSDTAMLLRKYSSQWQRFVYYIYTLNRKATHGDRYVLLFFGRHGEGFHNAAESYYGTPAWNCYWSEQDGNGTVTWADAKLTDTGIKQVLEVNRFWKHMISDQKITLPQTYYTSPMFRSLATADLTFRGLPLPHNTPFIPIIKENFREGISAHTCDRRSTKSNIRQRFPTYLFEKGFPENDPYWVKLHAETRDAQDIRSRKALGDVFLNDHSTYISVTTHSGEIASLLRVLGHRVFSLKTGGVLPVLVKVTALIGTIHPPAAPKPTPVQTCAAAPTIRDESCNDCSCCLGKRARII